MVLHVLYQKTVYNMSSYMHWLYMTHTVNKWCIPLAEDTKKTCYMVNGARVPNTIKNGLIFSSLVLFKISPVTLVSVCLSVLTFQRRTTGTWAALCAAWCRWCVTPTVGPRAVSRASCRRSGWCPDTASTAASTITATTTRRRWGVKLHTKTDHHKFMFQMYIHTVM